MSRHWRYWLIAVVVLAFLAALLLPAIQPARESGPWHRNGTTSPSTN